MSQTTTAAPTAPAPIQPQALAALLQELDMSQRALSRASGISLAGVHALIRHGRWPRRNAAHARDAVRGALLRAGASAAQWQAIEAPAAQSAPSALAPQPDPQEDLMLLEKTPLTPAALKHFGLPRSPFVDDVQSREDVYQSASTRAARHALLDAALHHGFIAIVGESGAGKTTLVRELEQRLIDEGRDVVLIEPYTLGMEASDTRGRTLKSGQIAESIIHALDPHATPRSSAQARFRQLHELLRSSRRAGRRHLLVIDEAHCLPVATLKHLKRFLDQLRDGMQRLLGIALIAQGELRQMLHSQNPEVREVMQRCEIVQLEPLDMELPAYIAHKFARFDIKPAQILTEDAFDALRARLIRTPRGVRPGGPGSVSTCHPLAVHNLLSRAMNAAAAAGWPQVDAQVIAAC